jgi:D-serine deaminase-like pyridoxal phosphate-dependent protein
MSRRTECGDGPAAAWAAGPTGICVPGVAAAAAMAAAETAGLLIAYPLAGRATVERAARARSTAA